ncbi:MAG: hypothetical protein HQL64_15230 [Magnetococcales bacterium]|nr:hypothetical protein [Magnetococcales bacterium]
MPDAGSDDLADQVRQQALAWSSAFAKSDHFASLNDEERRWSEAVVLEFVQAMQRIHGRPPRRWTAQSLTECCTRTLPARVVEQDGFFQALVPVLTGLIAYLAATGVVTNGPILSRALQRAQKHILARAADPDHWNMTKTLLTHAVSKGFDPTNPREMESFIDRINAGDIPEILPFPGKHSRRSTTPDTSEKRSPPRAKDPKTVARLQLLVDDMARDLAKEKPPGLTDELVTLLEQHPDLLLDMLSILAAQMQEEREDDLLLDAWFIILGFHLEQIRYGVDRNFTWAKDLVATFQTETIRLAREGGVPPMFLNAIMASLHEARLQPESELLATYETIMEREVPDHLPTVEEMKGMFETLFSNTDDDPFLIHAQMDRMLRVAPIEMQHILLQEMSRLSTPAVSEALALLILHPQAPLRQATRELLSRSSAGITPNTVRRLIVSRNWLPSPERTLLDQTIRSARQQGTPCAQWPGGEPVINRYALTMDGGGAMGFFLLSRVDSRQRLSSVLAKRDVGIMDAWSGDAISPSTMRRQLRDQILEEGFQTVSATFSTLVVKHHLHSGLGQDLPPPAGLLQVAETVAATDWQPEPLDFAEWLSVICGSSDRSAGPDAAVIQSSHIWSQNLDITHSWFMESQSLVDYLHAHRSKRSAVLLTGILREFFEPARQEWAERFAWTALWLHEQPLNKGKHHPLARNFALLSQHLFQGHPLEKIPLMDLLARNTIEASRSSHAF